MNVLRRIRGRKWRWTAGAIASAGLLAHVGAIRGQEVDLSKLPPAAEQTIHFAQDILPILQSSCLRCHGPERPRSRFRLDNRESALQGGASGVDIVPGNSAESPLIHMVSGLVEDALMPPPDEGDPLTPEQIGLLRAWIDQGVPWEESEGPKIEFSIRPSLRWIHVDGDEARFREHQWRAEGWGGGADDFSYRQQIDANRTLSMDGRILGGDDDYRVALRYRDLRWGFLSGGFEQFRRYYDDSGGYFERFDPAIFSLDQDLHLDVGRVWAEAGLRRPDWPRMTLGYEYRYREGTRATLHWGEAITEAGEARRIYPTPQSVDEQVHLIRLDIAHDFPWFTVEDNVRIEWYDITTERTQVHRYNLATAQIDKTVGVREQYDHLQAANTLRLEKQVQPWLFLSGGYLYSHLDGDAAFNMSTMANPGSAEFDDKYWFSDQILLEQDTHVVNANTQLGPWSGLTLALGVQGEWMSQRGFGNVRLDEGIPGSINADPALLHADIDKAGVTEHAMLRYTGLPATVLFAEGKLGQESIGQYEDEIGGHHEFLRDTDASSELADGRFGFYVSPWPRLSLHGHYRRRLRQSAYDHNRDEAFGFPNDGYSAFITSREIDTDEFQARLVLRVLRWLRTSFTYQKIATDFRTGTDPYIIPEFPPFPAEEIAPGERSQAGEYDADVFSLGATMSPVRRLHTSAAFTYRKSRTRTREGIPPVAPFEGESFSVNTHATYALNERTDLHAGYTLSWADYAQDNTLAGLPVGLKYDWHGVRFGIRRQLRSNVQTSLQYRFLYYDESNTGGANDYTAHGVFAMVAVTFR